MEEERAEMKISIVTPVLNGEKYIKEAIDSVLEQEGALELEYIIVDGGSTDRTLEILEEYEELYRQGKYQKNFKALSFTCISEADEGMYDALRKGFSLCHGEVLGWINADDFYLPGALKKVCSVFEDNEEVNWIAGCCSVIDEKNRYLHKSILRNYPRSLILNGGFGLHSHYFIPQESVFWRSTLMRYIDSDVFAGYKLAGDFYLWFTFAKRECLYSVDESFAVFRITDRNLSLDKRKYHNEMTQIIGASDTFCQRDHILLRSFGDQWAQRICRKEVCFDYICKKNERYVVKKCKRVRAKNTSKKLTIITICRNNPNVRYTCESIVNQLWTDYEWIVVDGASTDATLQILGEYQESIDLLISEPDNGIYSAMNKGIRHAHGEWIIFMNGGDQFCDYGVLENVFQDKVYDASVLYGSEERFRIETNDSYIYSLPEKIPPYFMCYQAFAHQAMFYRRELFTKYGNYDETYRITADSEKNTQLLIAGEKFKRIDIVVSSYVLDGLSNEERLQNDLQKEQYRRRKKYYSDKEIDLYQCGMSESNIKLSIPIIKVKSYKAGRLKKYYLFGIILLFTAERAY